MNEEEKQELSGLIILDPAWLSLVMRAVVELNTGDFPGDRKLAARLKKEGIASDELLLTIWNEFLPRTDNRDQSFHHLCTILKAYCLVYPLKECTVPNSEDNTEEPSSQSISSSESPAKQMKTEKLFLIPCMLPESATGDDHLSWITFYFDFEKFLPEVVYHRFVCQLIAEFQKTDSKLRSRPQFSKSLCRLYNINECNWKVELLRDDHRLKISVL